MPLDATTAESDGDLIEAIYDGILDPAALKRALDLAILRLGASGGNIHIVEAGSLETRFFRGAGEGYSDQAIADFLGHWQYVNAHRAAMRAAYQRQRTNIFLCHEHISEQDWERAAYFQDFFSRLGQRWLAGGYQKTRAGDEVSIAFSRPHGASPFTEHEARFIGRLLPHVRRAADLALKLGREQSGETAPLAEGLARSSVAACLIDAECRLHWSNPAGEAMISACPAAALVNGRLTLAKPGDDSRLRDMVMQTVSRNSMNMPAATFDLDTGAGLYRLDILPATLPAGALVGAHSLALVMIRQNRPHADTGSRIQELYDLTAAESALSLLVAEGLSVEEAAKRRNVSPHTIRAQMRSIFLKTGVSRAHALAALVWQQA